MTSRELSQRVGACDDQALHTLSKLTRGLARKLAGENASFEDFEAMTLAISRESDRRALQDQIQELEDMWSGISFLAASVSDPIPWGSQARRLGPGALCLTT